MGIRQPDFSGSWYPAKASDCIREIEGFAGEDIRLSASERPGVGGIVPHAGWVFSGRIACNVIKNLRGPDTVVLFGQHLRPGSPFYMMREGSWATPLGPLKIDEELAGSVFPEFSFTEETASRHNQDNTIELQLPFIKYFFPEAKILPIGAPPSSAAPGMGEKVAEISKEMGRNSVFLGSTDLTHYGYNYGLVSRGVGKEAVDWVKNENDKSMVDLICRMDAEGVIRDALKKQNACCAGAVGAAIAASKRLGATAGERLIYATSYDVRPDSSFVGYVGVVFS